MEPLHIGKNGPQLPCRFYDIPGIDDVGTIRKEELMKIINGKLRIDVTVIPALNVPKLKFNLLI